MEYVDSCGAFVLNEALKQARALANISEDPKPDEPDHIRLLRRRILASAVKTVSSGERDIGRVRTLALRGAMWCCSNEQGPKQAPLDEVAVELLLLPHGGAA